MLSSEGGESPIVLRFSIDLMLSGLALVFISVLTGPNVFADQDTAPGSCPDEMAETRFLTAQLERNAFRTDRRVHEYDRSFPKLDGKTLSQLVWELGNGQVALDPSAGMATALIQMAAGAQAKGHNAPKFIAGSYAKPPMPERRGNSNYLDELGAYTQMNLEIENGLIDYKTGNWVLMSPDELAENGLWEVADITMDLYGIAQYHSGDPARSLRTLARMTKPGGLIFTSLEKYGMFTPQFVVLAPTDPMIEPAEFAADHEYAHRMIGDTELISVERYLNAVTGLEVLAVNEGTEDFVILRKLSNDVEGPRMRTLRLRDESPTQGVFQLEDPID
ncbi:MAG: hypothetical protein HRT45_06085 [Bdellovibrionales bacterium]|nr:hypothetical protein [Bdellovibrionales bacterium]